MGIRVLGARLLVKEDKVEEATKSGIILTQSAQEPKCQGVVISVGEGALTEDGTRVPMLVSPGDSVIYTEFSGSPIEVEGQTYVILNERDVLAIVDSE